MTDVGPGILPRIPRRDLIAIVGALGCVVALAWWYLFSLSASMTEDMAMDEMEMTGMAMGDMMMIAPVWNAGYFLAMFLMWSVMMAGMMLPSVTPTVMIYSLVAKKAEREGSRVAPTAIFVSGYLIVWIAFSALATLGQYFLDQADLLTSMVAANSSVLAAVLIVIAGIWQFTPLKKQCLAQCRSPFQFISRYWQKGKVGALKLGLRHGLFCLGCCWAIMILLFVGGVMNLLWIALLSLFVLTEKLMPAGRLTSWIAGAVLIIAGLVILA